MRVKPWLAAAVVALAVSPFCLHRPAAVPRSGALETPPYRVRGAVHVHTERSEDARGSLTDVTRAAQRVGLDFVVVADHNVDGTAAFEGRLHGVLILAGLEKSTDGGHAIVLGTGPLAYRLDGDPATVVRDAADEGGFVIAAHPASSPRESAWTGELTGVAGIEVLNLADPGAWPPRDLRLLGPVLRYLLDPQGALLRAFRFDRTALDLWDRELAQRPMAGLLGSDAHGGFRARFVFVPLPSHEQVFRLASQHLLLKAPLTGRLGEDRRLILEAIRQGHGYAAFDSLADASRFRLEGRVGDRVAGMGESLPLEGPVTLQAEADGPEGTTLVLLRDGREAARGSHIILRTDRPGTYRVEAYLDPSLVPGGGRFPWIVSNPVYVYQADELNRRAEKAILLPAGAAPSGAELEPIDDFEGPRLTQRWQLDRSPDAWAHAAIEAGALRFDYALGPGPRTHASVCDFEPRDLRFHRSLRFRVRADRRTRLDVHVRVTDEADSGRIRIWRRSVRAETEWRDAVVPLDALKTYDRRGGRPNVGSVRGIYFRIDEATMPAGARGTVWVDDLFLSR